MKKKSALFALMFVVCTNISVTVYAQVNIRDSLALVDLYNSTNGPGWYNHTNWLTSSPISEWNGIKVVRHAVAEIILKKK